MNNPYSNDGRMNFIALQNNEKRNSQNNSFRDLSNSLNLSLSSAGNKNISGTLSAKNSEKAYYSKITNLRQSLDKEAKAISPEVRKL